MKIYNVENINSHIRNLVNNEYKYPLAIRGEMSNLYKSLPGHHYFTLSSGGASIRCASFANKNNADLASFDQEEVLVIGYVDFYITQGTFQIKVEEIDIYGEGALKKSIEKTRLKLENEGIFKNERSFTKYPNKVGVITSPQSDAFKDICSKFKERYPLLEIFLYPALVQGKNAVKSMTMQIERCNKDNDVDVLMIIRGGGSLEDLMPFNDENLARCIHSSSIPIVTGIGHQPDITIADYAADKAMETPTAAAVYISPDQFEILQNLDDFISSINLYITSQIENKKSRIDEFNKYLERLNPINVIKQSQNRYSDINNILLNSIDFEINKIRTLIENNTIRFNINKTKVLNFISSLKKDSKNIQKTLKGEALNAIHERTSVIKRLKLEIESCNPKNALKKGYGIISDLRGKILKTTESLKKIDNFQIELQDGMVEIKKNNNKKTT